MGLLDGVVEGAESADRDADAVEHILGAKLVAQLEAKLIKLRTASGLEVPESPHPIIPGD